MDGFMKTTQRALTGLSRSALLLLSLSLPGLTRGAGEAQPVGRYDGKPADMSKPVQVFILLGQSNMVGKGKVAGGEGSLENAVKTKGKYPHLVDETGKWIERQDARYVQYMSGKGPLANDWLTVKGRTIGPEIGIAHPLANAIDAPVMILKTCIGNRSLGWDLLTPGSERYEYEGKLYAGYKERPDSWVIDPAKGKAACGQGQRDKS